MKTRVMMVLLALGLCTAAHAATDYARIAFVKPVVSKGGPIDPSKYVKLVIEGSVVSHEKTLLSHGSLVTYVDHVLKTSGATYLAIYVREGSRYGEVVRAMDSLRKTTAENIAVNTVELPAGRDV